MRAVLFLIFIISVVVFQGTLFNILSVKGVRPDFPLILSCGIGVYKGEMKGLLFGGIIGLLMDVSTGLLIGPNLTGKASAGFLSGYIRGKIFRMTPLVYLSFFFILSLIDGITNYLSISIFIVSSPFLGSLSDIILPQAVYNSLIGTVLLIMFERIKPVPERLGA